jgi:ribose transport system substrate-binding protein
MIRFAAALASAATICVAAGGAWAASNTKVALVPGGPHPYFAAWEQAAADARRDFGLAEDQYKVPPKWELSAQNELIESTVSQGFNAFGIFPGDAVGTNATMQ